MPGGAGEAGCRGRLRGRGLRLRPGHRDHADALPDQPPRQLSVRAQALRARRSRSRRPTASSSPTEERRPMPKQTFILNGKPVTVDVEDDVRVLWVLRDLLGVTGPKYGCGINVCKACTSHVNGKAFNPCVGPGRRPRSRRRGHDHRGPAADGPCGAATCTRCRRPGSTATSPSAATASPARSWPRSRWSTRSGGEGRAITDADLDEHPQRLPLRHLHPHPRGDQGRCGADVRRRLSSP